MRFFFRSRKFKILASVLGALIVIAIILALTGETSSPGSNFIDTVTSPFKTAVNWVGEKVDNFFAAFTDYEKITKENEELKAENASLVSELMENQEAVEENAFLKEYLGIKEKNQDFIMEPAVVVSRDNSTPYASFTLNKGSTDGIALKDPVITNEGLVGYVTELGLSYCKVTTVLDSRISIAALDRRTGDIGVVSGNLTVAKDGKTNIGNISRSAGIASGDYIVTSGGGIFPEGVIIGRIDSVNIDSANMSLNAVVTPAVNPNEVEKVMILTYFKGQESKD